MRRSAMRRVKSSCLLAMFMLTTAAAESDAPARSPEPSSNATSTRRTRAKSTAPRALVIEHGDRRGIPGGVAVTVMASAPAAASASTSGCTSARAVAATVTTMRSAPACAGALQPKAASFAVQGVSRSICARTTPSRNSVARCGNSSGLNSTRAGLQASARRGCRAASRRRFRCESRELALDQPHTLEGKSRRRHCRGLDQERTAVLFNDLHGSGATLNSPTTPNDRACSGRSSQRDTYRGDVGQAGHRASARVSSMSSRQVRIR